MPKDKDTLKRSLYAFTALVTEAQFKGIVSFMRLRKLSFSLISMDEPKEGMEVAGFRSQHPSGRSVPDIGDECLFPLVGPALGPDWNKTIHQHKNGLYWWYDKSRSEEFGPFATEADAEKNLMIYKDQL